MLIRINGLICRFLLFPHINTLLDCFLLLIHHTTSQSDLTNPFKSSSTSLSLFYLCDLQRLRLIPSLSVLGGLWLWWDARHTGLFSPDPQDQSHYTGKDQSTVNRFLIMGAHIYIPWHYSKKTWHMTLGQVPAPDLSLAYHLWFYLGPS